LSSLSSLLTQTPSDNREQLRLEILKGINSVFALAGEPEYIKAVLFDELNVDSPQSAVQRWNAPRNVIGQRLFSGQVGR